MLPGGPDFGTKSHTDPVLSYAHFATYDYPNNVMNGVAYVPDDDTFLVTGKMWDFLWKIKLNYHDYVRGPNEEEEDSDEL